MEQLVDDLIVHFNIHQTEECVPLEIDDINLIIEALEYYKQDKGWIS